MKSGEKVQCARFVAVSSLIILPKTMSSLSEPITLDHFRDALKDLSDENLESIRGQLQLSLRKLRETNDELAHEIKATEDADDLKIYHDTIVENEVVIKNQTERYKVLETELAKRGVSSEVDGVYL